MTESVVFLKNQKTLQISCAHDDLNNRIEKISDKILKISKDIDIVNFDRCSSLAPETIFKILSLAKNIKRLKFDVCVHLKTDNDVQFLPELELTQLEDLAISTEGILKIVPLLLTKSANLKGLHLEYGVFEDIAGGFDEQHQHLRQIIAQQSKLTDMFITDPNFFNKPIEVPTFQLKMCGIIFDKKLVTKSQSKHIVDFLETQTENENFLFESKLAIIDEPLKDVFGAVIRCPSQLMCLTFNAEGNLSRVMTELAKGTSNPHVKHVSCIIHNAEAKSLSTTVAAIVKMFPNVTEMNFCCENDDKHVAVPMDSSVFAPLSEHGKLQTLRIVGFGIAHLAEISVPTLKEIKMSNHDLKFDVLFLKKNPQIEKFDIHMCCMESPNDIEMLELIKNALKFCNINLIAFNITRVSESFVNLIKSEANAIRELVKTHAKEKFGMIVIMNEDAPLVTFFKGCDMWLESVHQAN